MNSQLLTKILKYNNKTCPELVYENPLLNRNIANELSKSFVKILTSSKHNSQNNNNLRLCILENIRKLCNIQPEGHMKLNDNAFDALIELYMEQIPRAQNINKQSHNSCDTKLDEFLIRNLSDCVIPSLSKTNCSPESIQALTNLNSYNVSTNNIPSDIIHWDCSSNQKWQTILNNVWNDFNNYSEDAINDISLKMKPEIEKQILQELSPLIISENVDVPSYFNSNQVLNELAIKCSKSKECFRICINVINYLFIATSFNSRVETLVLLFINVLMANVSAGKYALLYPENLQCLAILMNISPDCLNIDNMFKNETLRLLNNLELHQKHNVIMLLSHYPQWIEPYMEFKNSNTY